MLVAGTAPLTLSITLSKLYGRCLRLNVVVTPSPVYDVVCIKLLPPTGRSNTVMSSVSNTCPGIVSSGPELVVSVTKPSPSILISSALIPFAVVYARSPPLISVS